MSLIPLHCFLSKSHSMIIRVSKARYALVDTTSSSVRPNVISDEQRKYIKRILTRLNSNVQTRRAHNFIDMAGFSPDPGSSISRPSHQHFRCRTC